MQQQCQHQKHRRQRQPQQQQQPAGQQQRQQQESGIPNNTLRVATVNVTQLTADRLHTIMRHASAEQVDVVALQETRHHGTPLPWANKIAKEFGWNATFSNPPPTDRLGRVVQGGTAVLWRRTLGRCSPKRTAGHTLDEPHRQATMGWSTFSVSSVYGPSRTPSPDWFRAAFQAHHCREKPQIVVGDFNWATVYEHIAPRDWHMADAVATTVAETAISRCFATTPVRVHSVTSLPGIPHHRCVVYDVTGVGAPPDNQPDRMTRCADYEWGGVTPTDEQRREILATISDKHAVARDDATLLTRWQTWYRRAEATLAEATKLGLATRTTAPERPKGSMPTTRPTSPGPRHREGETVLLRRFKRHHPSQNPSAEATRLIVQSRQLPQPRLTARSPPGPARGKPCPGPHSAKPFNGWTQQSRPRHVP